MEDKKQHLPMYGVGPVYVAVIITITVVAVAIGHHAFFEKGLRKGMESSIGSNWNTIDYFGAISLVWCGVQRKG